MLGHRVDIAKLWPIGECMCGGFQSKHGKLPSKREFAEKMGLEKRSKLDFEKQDRLRCVHIRCARSFALARDLFHYEKERLKNGGGRTEENQP